MAGLAKTVRSVQVRRKEVQRVLRATMGMGTGTRDGSSLFVLAGTGGDERGGTKKAVLDEDKQLGRAARRAAGDGGVDAANGCEWCRGGGRWVDGWCERGRAQVRVVWESGKGVGER